MPVNAINATKTHHRGGLVTDAATAAGAAPACAPMRSSWEVVGGAARIPCFILRACVGGSRACWS